MAGERIGAVLRGRYRIDALLGVGGMASVYRGAHRNGNRVAIKLLHAHLASNADVCARFLKEGYVANAVDHAGAVRVLDDDTTDDGVPFIVMELLDGESLEARFARAGNRLPADEVMAFAWQLLDVLAAAHDKGIVHRDIKPENLFVTTQQQLKVLDFGIARMRDAAQSLTTTRTGRMMGTPAYMPPEQALGLAKEIDARTDIWAVGATMYTLLSGLHVHADAQTIEQMLVFAATRSSRSVAAVAPDAPASLVPVVDRALAFGKDARHPDARTMQVEIERAYEAAFGRRLWLRGPRVSQPDGPVHSSFPVPPKLVGVNDASARPRGAAPGGDPASARGKGGTLPLKTTSTEGLATEAQSPRVPMHRIPRLALGLVGGMVLLVASGGLAGILGERARPGGGPSDTRSAPPDSTASATNASGAPVAPTLPADPIPAPELQTSTSAPTVPESVPPTSAPPPTTNRVDARAGGLGPSASPPKVDCSIPKYIDHAGRERWKPECVK
jgi:serine/threonine-protein kinase